MIDYASLAHHKNKSADYQRAKELRQTSPFAEQIFWHKIRLATKLLDIRFRRQHPINPYIVDFVCLKLKLVVEIDGCSHDTRLEYDKERDEYLRSLGYEVMRFTDTDVIESRDGVILMVLQRAQELKELIVIPLP